MEQADAWEALPGLYVRGDQTIGENMADVGGINFAYDALMAWLEKHPADNVDIDGFTPAQRCFIAWTQLWTEKTTDAFVRNQVTTNPQPLSRRGASPASRCLSRGVRHRRGRSDVASARQARARLVGGAPRQGFRERAGPPRRRR